MVPHQALHSGQPLAACAILASLTAGAEVLEEHECPPMGLDDAASYQVSFLNVQWTQDSLLIH